MNFNPSVRVLIICASILGAGETSASAAAEWDFLLPPNSFAANIKANLNPGYRRAKAQLFQEGAAYSFRVQGAGVDECLDREMPASVEKSAETTTITPEPPMKACPRIRLVIKNDGTGGLLQVKAGKRNAETWVDDENDYGLTKR